MQIEKVNKEITELKAEITLLEEAINTRKAGEEYNQDFFFS